MGLEIHAELRTASKMFCPCRNDPDADLPNSNICPICLGHPGTLPILNRQAIAHVIRMGISVGGTIADFTEWDRKNYFYPDIPKGYQITQYKYPLVSGGRLSAIDLERIHLEEDTAQSTHDAHEKSLINFNRSGVPLMELVTRPVIHDALTAVLFAKELQLLLRYLGAGEANMEKGEMRVEANISVSPHHPEGSSSASASPLGTKTEIKNLNSFRSVENAIAFEIDRQIAAIENGQKVIQETRGWDDVKGETFSQRSKESSHDYRYFPDPDIPKMMISVIPEFSFDSLKKNIPELPWLKRERFKKSFSMTDKEVAVFVESPSLSDYYESILAAGVYAGDPLCIKLTTNYLLSDYLGMLKKKQTETKKGDKKGAKGSEDQTAAETSSPSFSSLAPSNLDGKALLSPSFFAELVTMTSEGHVSSRGAKDTLWLMINQPTIPPRELAEKNGLIQKSASVDLEPVINAVISEHPTVVAEYKSGKTVSLQFLIGQAMKATKGSANPAVLKDLFIKKLS